MNGHIFSERLLLICHAEPMQARYADFRGISSGLTARGWQQAETMAEWLRERAIDRVDFTSHLPARLTAQHIVQRLKISLAVQPRLVAHTNGSAANIERLAQALQSEAQFPVLISDRTTIVSLVRHLFQAPRLNLNLDYTGVVELAREGEMWTLLAMNLRQSASIQTAGDAVEAAPRLEPHEAHLALIATTYNRVAERVTVEVERERRPRLQHLLDFAELAHSERILDVGTGSGLLVLMASAATDAEAVGVDVSAGMLEQAEYLRLSSDEQNAQRVRFRLAPAEALPFPDAHFDVVLMRLVLHHSEQPTLLIREAARVLRPQGILVIADLLSDADPVKQATQNTIETRRNPSHVAALSAKQYRELLVENGFAVLAESEVRFERNLDDWLDDLEVDAASRETVREMVLAGIETDAAGLGARVAKEQIFFNQRLFYAKGRKEE